MAYSAPELLLVGAAQQLVLQTSPIVGPPKQAHEICNDPVFEDIPGVEYDVEPGW